MPTLAQTLQFGLTPQLVKASSPYPVSERIILVRVLFKLPTGKDIVCLALSKLLPTFTFPNINSGVAIWCRCNLDDRPRRKNLPTRPTFNLARPKLSKVPQPVGPTRQSTAKQTQPPQPSVNTETTRDTATRPVENTTKPTAPHPNQRVKHHPDRQTL